MPEELLAPAPAPAAPRRSLRSQIAWTFGVLMALLSLLLATGFGEFLKWRSQKEAGITLQAVSRSAAKLLADGLLDRSRVVEVVATSYDLWGNGLESREVAALLNRLQLIQPHNVWIGVTDPDGTVRAATGGLLKGQSVAQRPWFQNGLKGLFVGDVHPAKLLANLLPPSANGEPLRFVDFSAPIRHEGQFLGVLGVHGSWDWAREVLEGLMPAYAQEAQLELFIFDHQGQLLHAPQGMVAPYAALGQTLPLRPPRLHGDSQRLQGQPQAEVVRWKDREDLFLTSVSALPAHSAAADLGWYIVARQPITTAFAGAQVLMAQAVGAGLVAALLASVIGWLLARRISNDLKQLAVAAGRIRDGSHASLPVAGSSREVHQLSTTLNAMTRRLLSANETMEREVQQRTQELRNANHELDLQARTDPLTGLLNRRGFDAQMRFAMALARRSGRPLCLMTLDIDHFKRANDRFGHDVGDQVLRNVADQLRGRLRDSDVLARFGGEEFVVLLPDTSGDAALAIAHELLHSIEATEEPVAGRITLSAGVSAMRPPLLNGTDDSIEALLRRSDEALYRAKNAGRNQAHFMP